MRLLIFFLLLIFPVSLQADELDLLKPGKHAFFAYYLSWDYPGDLIISKPDEDGWSKIEGEDSTHMTDLRESERNKDGYPDGYLKMSGKIKQISVDELLFKGHISNKINSSFAKNEYSECSHDVEISFIRTDKLGKDSWNEYVKGCSDSRTSDVIYIFTGYYKKFPMRAGRPRYEITTAPLPLE